MNTIFSNFIYQMIMQVFKIAMPIITIPIVSKALGPENIGLYSFSNSIVQYFILFASLGVGLYGQRSIALVKNDPQNLSKTFWDIEVILIYNTFLAVICYLPIIIFSQNKIVYIIQMLAIVTVIFDVSWFFTGIEKFKVVSLRSLAIQIITFMCIVFLIKNQNDTILYISIQIIGLLLSQICIWPYLLKYVSLNDFRFIPNNMKETYSNLYTFLVPQVAIILYTNMNKTILGFFDSQIAVGIFTNSIVLVSIVMTLVTQIDSILMSRITSLIAVKDNKHVRKILDISLNTQLFFTIPGFFLICGVSEKLVPWFFGNKFKDIVYTMPAVSIICILVPMGISISRQYLIPYGKIKQYNKSVFIGAIISVLLNLVTIPILGIWGCIFGTVVSELFVTITRVRDFIKDTGFKYDIFGIFVYLFSAIIMLGVIQFVTYNLKSNIITTICQIGIGGCVYLVLTLLYRNSPTRFLINYLNKKVKGVEF